MSLQERLEIIRASPAPRNEESAKFQILAPILQSLGWDPSEIDLEYSAGGKRSGGRIDMALKKARQVVALIEAKAPGVNLDDHVDQVIGYAHHEGVDICVLTTGLEWWLYLPRERGRPPKRRFAVLQLKEDPFQDLAADLTTFLGRESLINGQAEEQATLRLEHVRLNSEVPSIWKQMLHEPDIELVGLVQKRVHERAHLQLTSEQVAAALQESPIPSAVTQTASPEQSSEPTRREEQGKAKRKAPRKSVKPKAIELWGKRHPVTSHQDVLKRVIDLLYERHGDDFDRVLELKGQKHSYVARDPRDVKYGADGHYYEPTGSGYFFDTHLSANGIVRRASKLLQLFGHDPSEFEVLVDE